MNKAFETGAAIYPELATLQHHLAQLFQSEPGTSIRGRPIPGEFPALNVGTSQETIEIVTFLPGISAEALHVSIDSGLLIIAGVRNTASERGENDNLYTQERFVGSFRRVITLPEDADPQKIEASIKDGVLRITVAKKESSKPRRIDIR